MQWSKMVVSSFKLILKYIQFFSSEIEYDNNGAKQNIQIT